MNNYSINDGQSVPFSTVATLLRVTQVDRLRYANFMKVPLSFAKFCIG